MTAEVVVEAASPQPKLSAVAARPTTAQGERILIMKSIKD
ncbi:hypothetical protein GFS31_08830 [Leptolyngbya sp. BL0902]|nr:hypothetical protein GFS31_08830 [Leptolyngbya sp. BL0902]